MSRILFPFFILLSITVTAQQHKLSIDSLRTLFTSLAIDSTITLDGIKYKGPQIEEFAIGRLSEVFKKPIREKTNESYLYYYYTNNDFRSIIDAIPKLPIHSVRQDSEWKGILQRIDSLKIPERIFAFTEYLNRLIFLKDKKRIDELLKVSNLYIPPKYDELSLFNKAKTLEALGRFWGVLGEKSKALEYYFVAILECDSIRNRFLQGSLYEKIANLYSSINLPPSIKKSSGYYQIAAQCYREAGNTWLETRANLTAAQLLLWSPTTLLLNDYNRVSGVSDSSISMYEKEFRVRSRLQVENDEFLLNTAYRAFRQKTVTDVLILRHTNLITLGNYFMKYDPPVARNYFSRALAHQLQQDSLDLNRVMESLNGLAASCANVRDKQNTVKYTGWLIEIAKRFQMKTDLPFEYLNRADFFTRVGLYREGIEAAEKAIEDIHLFPEYFKDIVYERYVQCKEWLWQGLRVRDSADFYNNEYNKYLSYHLRESDELSQIENLYTYMINDDRMSTLNRQYNALLGKVSGLEEIIKTKELKINLLSTATKAMEKRIKDFNLIIRVKTDSLEVFDSTLKAKTGENYNLDREVAKKKKEVDSLDTKAKDLEINLKRTEVFFNIAKGIIAVAISVAIFFLVGVLRRNIKIKRTRILYSDMARSKLHDVKGSFNQILFLLRSKQFNKAQSFSEHSSDAFQLSLDKWDLVDNSYSLADEIDMANAIHSAYSDTTDHIVELEYRVNDEINIEQTIFISESISTCVSNSMRHAFDNSTKKPKIVIEVKPENRFLVVSVIDNGVPSKRENYLKDGKQEKGLYLLKRRLEYIFKEKGIRTDFEIFNLLIDNGTSIKFYFPYELSIKSNNS